MLPPAHRLRTGEDFQRTVRGGRKAGSRTLVAHLDVAEAASRETRESAVRGDTPDRGAAEPRVGLVVSRAVGNAVTRNRVKRRLRHLARARLAGLPAGSTLVLRALPAAASASSADLARDLDRALGRVIASAAPAAAAAAGPAADAGGRA